MGRIQTPRESAKVIAEDRCVQSAAELLLAKASAPELRVGGWKTLHELNPRAADEAAVNWVFMMNTLNFLRSAHDEHKCLAEYKGKTCSGCWSLCAAVSRALDERVHLDFVFVKFF